MIAELEREMYPAQEVLNLLRKIITKTVPKERRLYTSQLVCWLMLGEFLHGTQSLKGGVLEVFESTCLDLVGNCRRKRLKLKSDNTSGLSQARTKIPLEYFQLVQAKLHEELEGKELLWHGRRVFAVDGTTITTAPAERLRKAYQPNRNQHGQSAFPVVQLTFAHDLLTGVAEEPEWDPMYGEGRESELGQTLKLLKNLPESSVVVSDRAHGVFFVVWEAAQNKHDVLYRLTDARIKALLGVKTLKSGTDVSLTWTPSANDRSAHAELSEAASVKGRVIVQDVLRQGKKVRVCLFTTLLEVSMDDLIQLYGKRWEIEGEIRDLKKTLSLDNLSARTPAVLDRQILAAIISYNTVRAIILLAAKTHGIEDPKRLGFKNAVRVIKYFSRDLLRARNQREANEIVEKILRGIIGTQNTKRNRGSFPRTVHKRRLGYPQKKLLSTSSPI